jgi:hypothetical protein
VLPLVLLVLATVKATPEPVVLAQAALRYGVGVTKWLLLVSPLWETVMLVLRGGPENLGLGMAWVAYLSCTMGLFFAISSVRDLTVWFFPTASRGISTLRWLCGLLLITPLVLLAVTQSPQHVGQVLWAMWAAPKPTVAILFQEARVLSNFHVMTLVAALAVFFGVPHVGEFLRVVTPKKAAACLMGLTLALALFWTRIA